MPRLAIIDLGSNSVRMVIFDYKTQKSFRVLGEFSEVVRLAEGMESDQRIHADSATAAAQTLRILQACAKSYGVDETIIVGTSAIREAANSSEILDYLERETGIRPRVLSREEESYYGYLGITNALPLQEAATIDIGGGSMQLCLIRQRKLVKWESYQMGAVRLTERFVRSDPINEKDTQMLEAGIDLVLGDLSWAQTPTRVLVGSGGTIRTLARIDQKLRSYSLDRLHSYVLASSAIEDLLRRLSNATQREREEMSGLNAERADIIVAGATLLQRVMHQGGFDALMVSAYGLREGLFFERLLQNQKTPMLDDMRGFSVSSLMNRYSVDQTYAEEVQRISLALFDQLKSMHGLDAWERGLLASAALLHEIGVFVSYYDYHKHSALIIQNAPLLGFSNREVTLLALLVRYHRKGEMRIPNTYRGLLVAGDDQRLARLCVLLHTARQLAHMRTYAIQELKAKAMEKAITLKLKLKEGSESPIPTAEIHAKAWKNVYGRDLELSI